MGLRWGWIVVYPSQAPFTTLLDLYDSVKHIISPMCAHMEYEIVLRYECCESM